MQLRQTLLALVPLELAPELNLLVDHLQSLSVVLWQLYFLPELAWQMSALDRLQVQVAHVVLFNHGRVTRVCERARVPVALAGEVVFVPTEVLLDGLCLKGAVAIVDNLPNGVVLDHNLFCRVPN